MKEKITSTQAVRQFGDCLARVKYRGDSFIITRNEEHVAELIPAAGIKEKNLGASWSDIISALAHLPKDPDFADDIEQVNRLDRPATNPWA